MIGNILAHTDPLLKKEMPKFDFSNPPINPVELYHTLGQKLIEENGLGLSANQLGLPYRVFVIRSEEIIGCFNPMITTYDDEMIYLEEGCLSFPDLFVKIKRPRWIRVRYTTPDGTVVTRKFDGMTARVFQHELDHLNGISYLKRANRIHIEQARNEMKKKARQNKKAKQLVEQITENMFTYSS
jgi:peptide deformylase